MKLINGRRDARAASIGILLACVFTALHAHAAWDFVPDLELRAQSEDNPFYLPSSLSGLEQTAASGILDMSVQMATYNQRSQLVFEPNVIAYRYTGSAEDALDGEEWYFKGNGEYDWTTVKAGFYGDYRRQRLVTGEFGSIDYNLDAQNPDTGDTGRTASINQYRDFYYVSPYLAFTLSPRNTLTLGVTNSNVRYSGGDVQFRTGYDDTQYSATLQRNTDKQTQISAVMSVDDYKADINTNDFHTVTVQGQFTRPINQIWSFKMTAGVLRSDYKVVNVQDLITAGATTDYVTSIGFKRRAERGGLNAELARNVYPSSNGYSAVRREARVYGTVDLSQRTSLDYGVRLQETKTLGNLNSTDDRNYVDLQLSFSWAIKPVLFLVTGIEYQTQEFTNAVLNQGRTNATSLDIGVRYLGLSKRRPPKHSP